MPTYFSVNIWTYLITFFGIISSQVVSVACNCYYSYLTGYYCYYYNTYYGSSRTSSIIGGVIGCLVFGIILLVITIICCKKYNPPRENTNIQPAGTTVTNVSTVHAGQPWFTQPKFGQFGHTVYCPQQGYGSPPGNSAPSGYGPPQGYSAPPGYRPPPRYTPPGYTTQQPECASPPGYEQSLSVGHQPGLHGEATYPSPPHATY